MLKKLKDENNAVILSIDELMLTMFPDGCGEMHDTYVMRTEKYLLELSIQFLNAGIDVILDWGLWDRATRNRIREFYASHGNIKTELHYLKVSPEVWKERINKRNSSDEAAYYADEGLLNKVTSLFEEPSDEEVDVLIEG